jgi:predicted transcriptional regulator
MTQDLTTWLAQMPPASEIEARINEIENELELLQALKQVRAHASGGNKTAVDNSEAEPQGPSPGELRKRLSTERLPILRTILAAADKRASIPQVAQATGGDRANIASNMQRMVPAGLLIREGRGFYSVTSAAQSLLREMDGGQIVMS